ncbi:MAG TPA: YtxH domain-containing protein [Dehalococcoidia bacterium]
MRFILGLLIGVAIGAALGRLAPPESGKEFRQALKERLQPDAEEAEDGVTVGS